MFRCALDFLPQRQAPLGLIRPLGLEFADTMHVGTRGKTYLLENTDAAAGQRRDLRQLGRACKTDVQDPDERPLPGQSPLLDESELPPFPTSFVP